MTVSEFPESTPRGVSGSDDLFEAEAQLTAFDHTDRILKKGSDGARMTTLDQSTRELLLSISKEERDAIDKLTREFLMSRHTLIYVSVVIFILGFIIVGLLSAVVYAYNFQRSVSQDNIMMNKAQTSPIIVATGHQVEIITSELNVYDLSKIDMVNIVLGSGVNTTSFSLKPTGFVTFLCQHACDSTHVLHIYTNDAVIVYHGNQSYVAEPSARMLTSLIYHNSPSYTTLSKTLFQPHDDASFTQHQSYRINGDRKLFAFLVALVFRPVVSYVVKKVAKEVVREVANEAGKQALQQAQCTYNKYTGRYTC